MKMLDGFYYLIDCETYECGKRVVVARKLSEKDQNSQREFPKVRIEYGEGMFVIYRAIDNPISKEPMLVCTHGYISIV